ncbi:MAG: aminopeptidase P family protein, partial [Clostridia bacterium]
MKDTRKLFSLLDANIDAVLVISTKNRMYLTGFESTAGNLILFPNKTYFVTDTRYAEMAKQLELEGISVFTAGVAGSVETILDITKRLLSENNVHTVGYEDTELTVCEFNELKEKFSDLNFVAVGDKINKVRQVKDSYEHACIKSAQEATDKAFAKILKVIKAGMTEIELKIELEYLLFKNGGTGLAFDTIIASGINSSKPHAHPSDKRLAIGDAITMDFGASYNGYCSDMTRTVFLGKPSEEMKKIYNIVLLAQKNVINNVAIGMTGKEVDSLAREVIIANGYGDYFTHSTGHSLGIDIHEPP